MLKPSELIRKMATDLKFTEGQELAVLLWLLDNNVFILTREGLGEAIDNILGALETEAMEKGI